MMELVTGTWISQAVSVAADLGVADHLVDGPRAVEDIAKAVGADVQSLYRLLRALADLEIFQEMGERQFASTPLGDLLRSDAPGSLRGIAIMVGRPFHRQAWTGLLDGVRTGDSAFERVHGRPAFEYFEDHPEDGRALNDGMTAVSGAQIAPVVRAYDFGSARSAEKVVDVGGGHGALLASVLKDHPHLRGVLFDLPHVIEGAGGPLREAGVADRCEYVGGNFFEAVPAGDVYLMSNIIHDWGDEQAVRILANCHRAMRPGGRVLLGEALLPDAVRPSRAKIIDLEMLVMAPGARQRTENEYRELFRQAGLRFHRIAVETELFSLVEAIGD
jgi:SAM-dependent methyltransferase